MLVDCLKKERKISHPHLNGWEGRYGFTRERTRKERAQTERQRERQRKNTKAQTEAETERKTDRNKRKKEHKSRDGGREQPQRERLTLQLINHFDTAIE